MERREFITKSTGGMIGLAITSGLSVLATGDPQNHTTMNTARMKPFDVPHKGLRNALSQLSVLAGKTSSEDKNEMEQLHKLGKEVFLLLETHANDENNVTLKHLEARMKGASHHDLEDHIRIHVTQSRLEKMLDEMQEGVKAGNDVSVKCAAFYLDFSEFHSDYLRHMAEEERVTQQLLWDHFNDEELAAHRAEIMQSLLPETLLLWFRYVAPAQTRHEREVLFRGVKTNMPGAFFESARQVLQEVLNAEEYKALMAELK